MMKLEKLRWIRKITLRQVAAMCVMMVVIYFVAAPAGVNHESDEVNMVGSMGYSYEDDSTEYEVHIVYALHESGYLVKTEARALSNMSEIESIFTGIQEDSDRLQHNVDGLIPASAVLRDYVVYGDTVTLNLSESFLYYLTSIEEDLLASLVWSMTELSHIDRVHFQIEGEQVNNLNGGIDVGRGLTRQMGINLEVGAPRVIDTQMMLLYFFTDDTADALLVPVTRLVAPEVDPFEYAVSSLVKGPIGASYISVFNHRATLIEQPKLEDGIMTLNFCSELFFNQDQTQVSSQVIKQLVMTMTEFDDVHEVSVVIEGSSRVFDDAGNPITVPVGRNTVLGHEEGDDGFVKEY